ncbi:MAG: L,D-transpeptidase [Sporomusaceae bacterium]|jgi:hypothetical protein|nr:L,D-transpeptidase [Sporomusaceae bacterium]
MIVRLIYLPHRLAPVEFGESEKSTASYLSAFAAQIIEPRGQFLKRRADFSLPRGNILITKSKLELTVFDGNKPIRQFPVAIGKPTTPTPVGNFVVASKINNPGGMLGTRWLGLDYDAYGIHGNNAPWSIGKMASNGCIRMHNNHVEELYVLVKVGTPVYIRD